MALLDQEYNSDQLPKQRDYTPVPGGWYNAVVTESEAKKTKDGDGVYFEFRFDISGPAHAGRCVYTRVNTRNKSDKCQEIGLGQLNAIMAATGVHRLIDDDQFLIIPLQIHVTIGVPPVLLSRIAMDPHIAPRRAERYPKCYPRRKPAQPDMAKPLVLLARPAW